jgi:hypothetical protein
VCTTDKFLKKCFLDKFRDASKKFKTPDCLRYIPHFFKSEFQNKRDSSKACQGKRARLYGDLIPMSKHINAS